MSYSRRLGSEINITWTEGNGRLLKMKVSLLNFKFARFKKSMFDESLRKVIYFITKKWKIFPAPAMEKNLVVIKLN